MAKGSAAKKIEAAVNPINVALLASINSGATSYISKTDAEPLLHHTPQLIEVNPANQDASGNAAVRLTDAGKALMVPTSVASTQVVNPFAIIKNAVLPPSKKRGKSGGAPAMYPWAVMEVGDSFFVPVSEQHPDPLKSMSSAVSSANMKFSVPTGEVKNVTRTKRTDGNKALLDESGNKVKETVVRPVMRSERKFSVRGVKAGDACGEWVAPINGAFIQRVA